MSRQWGVFTFQAKPFPSPAICQNHQELLAFCRFNWHLFHVNSCCLFLATLIRVAICPVTSILCVVKTSPKCILSTFFCYEARSDNFFLWVQWLGAYWNIPEKMKDYSLFLVVLLTHKGKVLCVPLELEAVKLHLGCLAKPCSPLNLYDVDLIGCLSRY